MRAFVAGATGYTGREVVRELHARGVEVIAHVRPDSPQLAKWQRRFEGQAEVDTTPWKPDLMRDAMLDWRPTHVFALLGTTRARARKARERGGTDSYETIDYGLSALLMQAAQSTGLGPKFVYLSSIGVNAKSKNPYISVRWRMESELRASGLPFVIARPAIITGSDRDEVRQMERVLGYAGDAALDLAGLIGLRKLRNRLRSLTGPQLARALVVAALDPQQTNVLLDAGELRDLSRTK